MNERKVQKSQFQELEETKEYCETQYYETAELGASKALVGVTPFWADVAQHFACRPDQPFLSFNFIYGLQSHTEMVATLALLDLPFKSANHGFQSKEGRKLEVKAADNLVLFKREIKEAPADIQNDLLVIHRFFDYFNRASESKIREFLRDEVYGCEVIITNVSASSKDFQVLW